MEGSLLRKACAAGLLSQVLQAGFPQGLLDAERRRELTLGLPEMAVGLSSDHWE